MSSMEFSCAARLESGVLEILANHLFGCKFWIQLVVLLETPQSLETCMVLQFSSPCLV